MLIKALQKKLYVVIFILALLVLSINIGKPFVGHHDFMSAFEGMQARNYLKYGLWKLKFGAVSSHVQGPVEELRSFTVSYLPLLSILISVSFSIFGVIEWAERLIPALFTSIGALFFFLICRKLWNQKVALMASLFYILNPMFIYFGKLPAPDMPVLSLMLISFYFYIKWLEKDRDLFFYLLNASLFIGGLFGWTIVYFGPLIILHSLIVRKFKVKLFIPVLITLFTIFLQLFHTFILTGSFLSSGQLALIKFRFAESNFSFGGVQFNLINYIKQEIAWFQAYFTRVVLILSSIYVIFNLNKHLNTQKASILFLLGLGVAHPIIFSRYVFVHDFLNIYILPFLAISAALGLLMIVNIAKKHIKNQRLIFTLILIILIIFIFERIKFTRALLDTQMNKPGKDVAIILNELQRKDNEAVIVSARFKEFYEVFINYYSKYSYAVTSEGLLTGELKNNKYKYVIAIDEDIADRKLYNSLVKKYKSEERGIYTIIYIDKLI